MKYEKTVRASFISRPNRFIAYAATADGETVICHVKNTGRCRELLVPGAEVILSDERDNKNRKTPFDLVAVRKGDLLINMDSQAPNKAAAELLKRLFPDAVIKPEVSVGKSRIDFLVTDGGKRRFVEVKGVTLEENGVAMFPDAPTERGAKHLDELMERVREGDEAQILFVVQMKGPTCFKPNEKTDSAFAEKLRKAAENGVVIRAFDCIVTDNSMVADMPIRVEI